MVSSSAGQVEHSEYPLGSKADIHDSLRHVRFGPEPDFVAAKIERAPVLNWSPLTNRGQTSDFAKLVSCDYGRAPVDLHIAIVESERVALEHFPIDAWPASLAVY